MRISDWSSDVCSSDLDDIFGIAKPQDFHFLRRQRDQALVARSPEPVAFETEIFEADAREFAVGHHFGRPAAEILHPADLHLAVVDIDPVRSEEHTSELQSLMRNSYAVFCFKKQQNKTNTALYTNHK